MANNFKFGVSREQQEKEQAEKQRQLEEEIQERTMEKTRKLRQLHSKQKRNKIIVVTFFIVFFLLMATFGTYNTFFKQPLSESQVRQIAIDSTPAQYNSEGVQGYIYDNLDNIATKYFDITSDGVDEKMIIEVLEVQKDSLRVTDIKAINNALSRVNFEVDILIKYKDYSSMDNQGQHTTVTGETFIDTYQFSCLVGYDVPPDGSSTEYKVYYFASDIKYISSESLSKNIMQLSNALLFVDENGEEIKQYDEEKTALIRTSIENILINLYAGRDVSTQLKTPYNFSNSTDEFVGFKSFAVYEGDNALGFNCVAQFLVRTERGMTYTNTSYFKIEKDGTSYKITNMY